MGVIIFEEDFMVCEQFSGASFPQGKISSGAIILGSNCPGCNHPGGNCPGGQLSVGQSSSGAIVRIRRKIHVTMKSFTSPFSTIERNKHIHVSAAD